MKKLLPILSFLLLTTNIWAQEAVSLEYYLPSNVEYNPSIPKPQGVLGYQVGEWHVSHDQLVSYMRVLANASDRVSLQEYGRTYENRPLLLLTITSPANHGNIETIREEHAKLVDPEQSGSMNTDNMPIVTWLGYSVHGNEPSGSNSSLLVAYHLAAAQGAAIDELLDNTVILLDPSVNPDGLNRFSTWVNMHKSRNLVYDGNAREYNEVWPGGRTNHYWFDLNRDWLPTQLPESQGRIAQFQRWRPNILTDHHEMGTNSTFFFQPGIPSRKNPLTPQKNVEMTGKIANFHAKALDNINSLYYSEESFDDFYYGKGSTYPDVQGAVGILFEQASSRGHAQESIHGIVRFPFTIKNQFTVSLSTLEASVNLRKEMLDYQRDFYQNALQEARKDSKKAYIFGAPQDKAREYEFVSMLLRHQIKVHQLAKDVGKFKANQAYVVPLEQAQYRLIEAAFRTQQQFQDSLFYDVSSWTLPMAFNIPYQATTENTKSLLGKAVTAGAMPEGQVVGTDANVGYAFRWDGYYAPKALYHLQTKGIRAKVATRPFSSMIDGKKVDFKHGTVIIPKGIQPLKNEDLDLLMKTIAEDNAIDVYALNTGLAYAGVDMGSPSFEMLEQPKVMIVGGSGTSSYDVGEAWHLMDQRYHVPVSVVDADDLSPRNLDRYNTIVLVDGSYSFDNGQVVTRLKQWLADGGTLIAIKGGARWASQNGLSKVSWRKDELKDSTAYRPYDKLYEDLGSQRLGGSIFQATIDPTHPIGYGFTESTLPVFRRGTDFADKSSNPYATPLRYTDNPLLSGYISKEVLAQAKGSAAVIINSYGRGRTISMLDNPNFRAFWLGTNKLFANAIFFGSTIAGSSAR